MNPQVASLIHVLEKALIEFGRGSKLNLRKDVYKASVFVFRQVFVEVLVASSRPAPAEDTDLLCFFVANRDPEDHHRRNRFHGKTSARSEQDGLP